MKDLDQRFQGSELQAELLKSSSYQKGRNAGSQAVEPPSDLNQVVKRSFQPVNESQFGIASWERQYRYKSQVREEPVPVKIAFRQGYFDGLREFLAQHDISLREAGASNFPDVMTSKTGFDGFVRGLNRRKPAVGRDYTKQRQDDKLLYKYEPEPGWVVKQRFDLFQTLSGYELGFIINIAKDFGVKLNYLAVPRDDMAYDAFVQGLSAEPREIPLKRVRDRSIEKYQFEENPYEIYEATDNNTYLQGLNVWLASKGLGHIEAWQVRHPEALRTFKAALEERVLPEYEPIEPVIRTPTYREERIKNYPREDSFNKINGGAYRPSPFHEARREGASGYALGKAARLLRQTLEVRTKTS